MKKNVMITIDAEIVKKAKEIGLNISKVSENALKEMIKRIESPNPQIKHNDCSDDCQNDDKWGCPDLNRGLSRATHTALHLESPSLQA